MQGTRNHHARLTSPSQVFDTYAELYDLFYAHKDYRAECRQLIATWTRHDARRTISSVLDLGCGTGGHAIELARQGYQVVGIDRSPRMLKQAARKSRSQNLSAAFISADIRLFSLTKTFDAAIAMFAVLGYLTCDQDLVSALASTRRHLPLGGLFVFDVWHGPAVLRQGPEPRTLEVKHNGQRIRRHAIPQLDTASRTVTVDYTVRIDGTLFTQERHILRYFFPRELERLAKRCGFVLTTIHPFMAPDTPLSDEHWNVTCVFRAI